MYYELLNYASGKLFSLYVQISVVSQYVQWYQNEMHSTLPYMSAYILCYDPQRDHNANPVLHCSNWRNIVHNVADQTKPAPSPAAPHTPCHAVSVSGTALHVWIVQTTATIALVHTLRMLPVVLNQPLKQLKQWKRSNL